MPQLLLDATEWNTKDDVYDAFFRAVGAPSWHGRNFDALRDSIKGGQINEIEVPYCLVIKNSSLIGEEASRMMRNFIDLIFELAAEGCPVDVRVE